MARNLQQIGHVVPVVAPSGGVESGEAFLVQSTLCIAQTDAVAGAEVQVAIEGVYDSIPADDNTAFANLAPLFWNATDGALYNAADGGTGTGHPFVGICIGGKLEAADTCSIKLLPGN